VIGKATSLTAVALGLVLAGCASEAGTSTKASYSLGRGTASYDQLRRDSERCAVDGGKIEAKQDGGDPTQLANYTCVMPKGRK
jgi:outer membrane murein-binding lipoprotein Lpp